MARITVAGASNWRAAFEGHPGLAVTPENYARLMSPPGAAAEPEAAPGPERAPVPATEPAVPPRVPPRRPVAEDGG